MNIVFSFVKNMNNHNEHVTENILESFKTTEDLKEIATYKNVHDYFYKIVLQSEDLKGSLINFNENFENDEWAVSFDIENLFLKDFEKSGVYIWFTNNKIEKGDFRNGSAKFSGLLAGIEFSHEKADLVFSFNNDIDFFNKENSVLHHDHINPSKIENIGVLTVKIIHTKKNLKFEVYDGDNLISDSFRINDPLLISEDYKKRYFSITSYYEKPKIENSIVLSNFKISDRIENNEYQNSDLHVNYNEHKKSESDEELTHAVADIAHFISYISIAFGAFTEPTISELIKTSKTSFNELKEKLEDLISKAEKESNFKKDINRKDDEIVLDKLNESLDNISDKIELYKKKLENFQKKNIGATTNLGNFVLGFGIFIIVFSLIKALRNTKEDKNIKNE